ncbi:MAG: response regulator transcription factor [Propionicimonas sp.]|uniref:response regulator n=1 Tax=Propionicimonas sp. TaxID=1955623 RepID=UPI003D0A3B0A
MDDDLFVRTVLADLLTGSGRIRILSTHADGAEAAAAAALEPPDVALVDISMPLLDGPSTVRALRASSPRTRILALTSLADPDAAAEMLRAGAAGFLPKDLPVPALVHAIEAARYGVSVLAGAGAALAAHPPEAAPSVDLTDAETAILELLLAGRTNAQIAGTVYLSPSSVKHQVSALMAKLGATNRVTLAIRARELGLG